MAIGTGNRLWTGTAGGRLARFAKPALVAEPVSPYSIRVSPAGEQAKAAARRLADATPLKLRLSYAQGFCAAVIARYWTNLQPRPFMNLRPAPHAPSLLRREALEVIEALEAAARGLSIEEASYLIGSSYAIMLPPELRSDRGVFYTPPAVVEQLLDSVTEAGVDWSRVRALDLACGGGAFVAPMASRMLKALVGCDPRMALRNIAGRLKGYEIDPFAAWMSQVFLDALVSSTLRIPAEELGSVVEVCDSLTRLDGPEHDLVVGNPPYGRCTLTKQQRETFKRSLFGHANQYGLFLDLALRRVCSNGIVGYVTPTGFLGGEYFKRLRELLVTEATPLSFDFISDRTGVFDDVLQETMLAVFRKVPSDAPKPKVHLVQCDAKGQLRVERTPAVRLTARSGAPWLLPRTKESVALVECLGEMPTRLRHWGYQVSTGPLVWNRFKTRLRLKPDASTVPLIWAESVGPDGTFAFRSARRNHLPYFSLRDGDEWLLVTGRCILVQRTTAKEQPRRIIAAELPLDFVREHGAVVIENHLNMVVPIVPRPAVEAATVAAFLNSAIADRVFRCISGSVAVSAYELESMPLPNPDVMQRAAAAGDVGSATAIFAAAYGTA
ncbi:MAG: Eco57I restriction-modification methylase domain-containing protein [Candidatus Didemnitutus sp.]|nr:Eco57I restriction-modification methylase domain-containing protein [Candidatus Didemnitutus sp.]